MKSRKAIEYNRNVSKKSEGFFAGLCRRTGALLKEPEGVKAVCKGTAFLRNRGEFL